MAAQFDAVVLAGGQARRLGGGDKPALVVGGTALLTTVVSAAAAAGANRVVIVGPPRPALRLPGRGTSAVPGGLVIVREDPPGSGPVPALARGLAEARAGLVAVLAADLPFLRARDMRTLLAAVAGDRRPAAGAVLADQAGRPQWLVGCWRTEVLRRAIGAYRGTSLHGLLRPLRPAVISWRGPAGEPPPWLDCDTEQDIRLAEAWLASGPAGRPEGRATAGWPAAVERLSMNPLQAWTEAACGELGIDPADLDTRIVLDLAREVAHQVERPAAPLTAYLLGLAVGRGRAAADAAERLNGLAAGWTPPAND